MDKNDTRYIKIGLKIAYYRKLNGMTQEQIAEEIGPQFRIYSTG